MAAWTIGSDPNRYRAHRIASATLPHLQESARSAEVMAEQAFAEDLWAVSIMLAAILRAAERRRYVSPVSTFNAMLPYVTVSR